MTVTVAPERARYCVVALFDALTSGHRFERREWPAHVTLAANFVASTSADEVVAAGLGGPAMEHAVSVRLGEPAPFGHEGEIPVLLVDSPQVEHVHRELVDRLERLEGFAPDEPALWHAGAVTFTEQRRLRLRDYLRLLGARGLTEDGDLDRLFESN